MAIPAECWGNRQGWIIASVVGAVLVTLVLWIVTVGGVTEPTDLGRGVGDALTIAVPPELASAAPRGDGRAYRTLSNRFLRDAGDRRDVERFVDPRTPAASPRDDLVLVEALADVPDGAGAVFGGTPEVLVNHRRSLPELDALDVIGRAAVRQASLLAARGVRGGDEADLERAASLYLAAAMLGRTLMEERLTYRQFQTGYRLAGDALNGLGSLARARGDAGEAARYAAAAAALKQLAGRATTVWDAVGAPFTSAEGDERAQRHAGDVLAIADNARADVMWRTDAALRLGVMKHAAPRRPDREAAARVAERLARQPDPENVWRAAALSAAMTADQVHAAR